MPCHFKYRETLILASIPFNDEKRVNKEANDSKMNAKLLIHRWKFQQTLGRVQRFSIIYPQS